MTPEERLEILAKALGGDDAKAKWSVLMAAAHEYARASGCPLGNDVLRWAEDQTRKAHEAIRDDMNRRLESERTAGFVPLRRTTIHVFDTDAS
jgi:hypothetical protein